MRRSAFFLVTVLCLAGAMAGTAAATTYTATVSGTSNGVTEKSIGAVEACSRFNISDITDLGIENYRFYAGMERLEPVDDDGVYGSPSIAQIKANPNIIPWTVWDQEFQRPDAYWWTTNCLSTGSTSLESMLSQLVANGVKPVVTLRNVENQNPTWAWQNLNPPHDQAGWNEWWEYVFATVYTVDVRYGLDVNDWEVLNEPDKGGQLAGWGGTQADYQALLVQTADAIKYVYATYLPGRSPQIYAPEAAGANTWITTTIQQNDANVDVYDWHDYSDPTAAAQTINGWIDQYGTDGVHEPLYLGEWGSYRGAYSTLSDAMTYATQLDHHSLPGSSYIASSAIFSMYDWSSSVTGLVSMNGTRSEPYYALRLMIRGLQGAKTEYPVSSNIPAHSSVTLAAAKDPATGTIYVEFINGGSSTLTISLDLSAFASTGTVTYRQYSSSVKDAITGTGTLSAGKVTLTVPGNSIVQVIK